MIEEILPNLYRIEVPLPRNPLKTLNSYVIKAGERSLIIDTGMNREECQRKMSSSLEELGINLNKTDFFITHLHVDHMGLVANLATATSNVYFNRKEASIVDSEGSERVWQGFYKLYLSSGFPEDELKKSLERHPGNRYGPNREIDFRTVKENDMIEIGDYLFRCIETPGHSPGHMCLYDAAKKLLVSGDHILFDITPNITSWPEIKNSLKEYLTSLEKVYALDVNLVLPGHRNIGNDHRQRIRELQEHHQARANEILVALKDGEKTAFQIAPYVTWDVNYGSWELFPPQQKWFAVGETIAHLEHLEDDGAIQRKTKGQKTVFERR
ncbi:MBL fold metallo-hydrolase [Chloroflexota bacterium]